MMNETFSITLPLPPAVLSPNKPPGSIGGRMAKARASAKYRRLAREAAEGESIESGPWELTQVTAFFFHKTNRRRDDVNHLAMLKPAYDGVVDVGILADDDSKHLKTMTPTFSIDKCWPRVELLFERLK